MSIIQNVSYLTWVRLGYEMDPKAWPTTPLEFCLNYPVSETLRILGELLGVKPEQRREVIQMIRQESTDANTLVRYKEIFSHLDSRWHAVKIVTSLYKLILMSPKNRIEGLELITKALASISDENCEIIKKRFRKRTRTNGRIEDHFFSQYLGHYAACMVLGLPLDGMQYWDFSIDKIETNINATGVNIKTVLREYMKVVAKLYPEGTYLDEILNMRYLNNVVDTTRMYGTFTRQMLLSRHITAPLERIIGDNYRYGFSTALMVVAPKCDNDLFDINSSSMVWGSVLAYWLEHYTQWLESGTNVTVNGKTVYVHHHSVIEYHAEELSGVELGKIKGKYNLPVNLKVNPAQFYEKYFKLVARKIISKLHLKYKSTKFPPLPGNFSKLDPKRWRQISSPVELSQEGAIMSHCVGGANYISAAEEGDLFFHYDDGKPGGVTLHLAKSFLGYLGCHWTKDGMAVAYEFTQAKGRRNRNLDHETTQQMLDDLRAINTYQTPEQLARKEFHEAIYSNNHPAYLPKFDTKPYNSQLYVGEARHGQRDPLRLPRFGNPPDLGRGMFDGCSSLDRDYLNEWTIPIMATDGEHTKPSMNLPADFLTGYRFGNSDGLLPNTFGREKLLGLFNLQYCQTVMTSIAHSDCLWMRPNDVINPFYTHLHAQRLLWGFASELELRQEIYRFGWLGVHVSGYNPVTMDNPIIETRETEGHMFPSINRVEVGQCRALLIKPVDKSGWVKTPPAYSNYNRQRLSVDWSSPTMKKIFGHVGAVDYVRNVIDKMSFNKPARDNMIVTYSNAA